MSYPVASSVKVQYTCPHCDETHEVEARHEMYVEQSGCDCCSDDLVMDVVCPVRKERSTIQLR